MNIFADKNLIEEIKYEAKRFSVDLDNEQQKKLEKYLIILNKWGKAINLTADSNPVQIITKHFVDAFAFKKLLENYSARNLIVGDIGSGGGLPGIILSIILPNWNWNFIEINKKKCTFLSTVIHTLELKKYCSIHSIDAESYSDENFDLVLSRALWKPENWLEKSLRLLLPGGFVVTFEVVKNEFKNNNFDKVDTIEYKLRDNTPRLLSLYRKAV